MTDVPMLPRTWACDLSAAARRIDWFTIGWTLVIPLFLLWCGVVAVVVFINDYLNPPPVRRWFADRFSGPDVKLIGGFIPLRKPFHKWDAGT